jgi:hypothetical protein
LLIVTCPCAFGRQVAAEAETAMSNLRLFGGWSAAALIDAPMNSAPSASDTADVAA